MNWMPSYESNAQVGHFCIATTLYLLCLYLRGDTARVNTQAVVLLAGYAVAKEFVWDILLEEDSWANSLLDFNFYLLGTFTILAISWLRNRTNRSTPSHSSARS